MSKEQVEVIIDSNEAAQNEDLTEVIVLHEDVADFKIEPLDEGDIKIQNCLFERKTPADFAQSLQEGRLREQVERMGDRGDQSFVLVEGNMEDFDSLEHTQIPPKSLRGMTASIIARNRTPVVFCSKPELLADMAVRLARKTAEEPTTIQTTTTDTVREPTFIENVFLGVDGVGIETAEKLSEKFPSLQSVYNASQEELKAVDGVGETVAGEIHQTVHTVSESTSESNSDGGDDGEVEVISV